VTPVLYAEQPFHSQWRNKQKQAIALLHQAGTREHKIAGVRSVVVVDQRAGIGPALAVISGRNENDFVVFPIAKAGG
jgi:hypothetical protein